MRIYGGLALAAAIASSAIIAAPAAARADGMPEPAVEHHHHSSYNWSGVYVGANAGWFNADIDGTYVLPPPDKHSVSQSDGIYGLHLGAQHQFGHLVVGIEGAYSVTPSDSWGTSNSIGPSCLQATPVANRTCSDRMRNLATIGGRLGWAPNNQWLLFASGGYATANLQSQTSVTSTGVVTDTANTRADGWYIGGGVEFALTRNWILGVEYQHVDLGDGILFKTAPGPLNINDRTASADADIVRARISFKLGREAEMAPLK